MNPPERVNLILSLFNGNIEPVTLLHEGKEKKGFVSASPKQNGVQVHTVENGELIKFNIKPVNTPEHLSDEIKSNVPAEKKSRGRSV